MATFTPLLNLRKPATTDLINVATDLNANLDIIDTLGAVVGGGAWTAYTPIWGSVGADTPAIGNGTLLGRYQQVGKTVDCFIYISAGSTTTFGTGNVWTFSLPTGMLIGAYVRYVPLGATIQGGTFSPAVALFAPGLNTFQALVYNTPTNPALGGLDKNHPVAWASGHVMNFNFRVEIA